MEDFLDLCEAGLCFFIFDLFIRSDYFCIIKNISVPSLGDKKYLIFRYNWVRIHMNQEKKI